MTGYAQVKSQASDGNSFTLSLKSVNHRFLDPQLRLPPEMEALEVRMRRILKERLARGHVEVTLAVEHRDGGYYWISTKQTAMVVFGLIEYVKISHELDADFTADIYVNDNKVFTRHFTREDSMKGNLPSVYLTSEQLRSGNNTIRIQKSGTGRFYWSARGEYYSTEKKLFQNNKLSLNITRDYYRLAPQQKGERIVYNLEPLQGEVHSGDVIAVRLSVNGSDLSLSWKV